MSATNTATFAVPAGKQAAIKQLLVVPLVPAHVLLCLAIITIGPVTVDVLALTDRLALPMASICNVLLMYFSFTVLHDAIHRSAAKSQRLNDLIGAIGLIFVFPHIGLSMFRWAHIQHHRFTNDAVRDPDRMLHCAWWQMPIRFMLIDVAYLGFIIRRGDAVGRRHLKATMLPLGLTCAVIAGLTYLGYGREVLYLWVIPSRVGLAIVGFIFFWLPHVKDDVPAAEDITLASSVRLGHEWLLSPLMQGHNYHMIHHLFPGMPSNRHQAAWRLLEPELWQRRLQIQRGFAIHPVVHEPRQ